MLYKGIRLSFVFLLLLCLLTGCAKHEGISVSDASTKVVKEEKTTQEKTIMVYVCGAVKKPGVFQVDADARVVTAIEKAGGLTKNAALESINQAETMKDGQQIYVPSKKETKETSQNAATNEGETSTDKVNLNSATKEQLMTLPGIGESKADAIIAYRTEQGSFQSVEDIMKISGIKEGVYSKIKNKLTV